MQKQVKIKNIVINIIDTLKKQDFLVYFRKVSILELSEKEVVFGVVSSFMKDNLEAKFEKEIFAATKLEIRDLEKISFKIDSDIDNPSNPNVLDCSTFYKEANRKNKKTTNGEKSSHKEISNSKSVNDRYNL
jgi:chromosomal replication initiation ATPase DnaA